MLLKPPWHQIAVVDPTLARKGALKVNPTIKWRSQYLQESSLYYQGFLGTAFHFLFVTRKKGGNSTQFFNFYADPCIYFLWVEYKSRRWQNFRPVCRRRTSYHKERKSEPTSSSNLQKIFDMKSGSTDRFIAMKIWIIRSQRTLYFTQTAFIRNLLKKFRMEECNLSKPNYYRNHRRIAIQ